MMIMARSTTHGAEVQVFCVDGQGGNTALVFASHVHERVSIDACIEIARAKQSEVTWIQRGATPSGLCLRFFTAAGEIAFCGHGTLGAAAWLFQCDGGKHQWIFDVAGEPVRVQRNVSGHWWFPQVGGAAQCVDDDALADALLALGLPSIDGPRATGAKLARSKGAPREKLLLQLPDAAWLCNVAVDPERRDALCERLEATGIYVFAVCTNPTARIIARHFPSGCGTQEDIATGGIAPTVVRHAGLSTTARDVVIEQGGPQCRSARLVIGCADEGTSWRVAGECLVRREVPLSVIAAPAR
jgi:PhzF family phenazine biosynthesis protein